MNATLQVPEPTCFLQAALMIVTNAASCVPIGEPTVVTVPGV